MKNITTLCQAIERVKDTSTVGIYFINNDHQNDYVSYAALYQNALKVLGLFQEYGLRKGDTLVFQFDDNKMFIQAFWACILGGIIPVPLAPANQPALREKIINVLQLLKNPFIIANNSISNPIFENNQSGAYPFLKLDESSAVIKNPENCPSGIIAGIEPDDLAFIQFSSGSTSSPKGVTLTHRNLICNINAIIDSGHYDKSFSSLSWMPLTHDMGLIGFHLSPLVIGINQYLMPTSLFIRHPTLWLKKISEYRITVISSPNFGFKYLINIYQQKPVRELDLCCVKVIYNGAEPISKDITEEFLELLAPFGLKKEAMFPVYGLAEASLAVTAPKVSEELKFYTLNRKYLQTGAEVLDDPEGVVFVDVGFPVKGVVIRIVDDADLLLPEKHIGNIEIKGENVTKGYYNDPVLTRETITPDGWLRTGDLGFIIQGRLVITGRKKDLLFVNGQNYYSHDLEKVAENVDGIEPGNVAAVGVRFVNNHEENIIFFIRYTKSDLKTFIELSKKLKLHIFQKLGIYTSSIIPIKKIPETTSGKVQRFKLKERFETGEFDSVLRQIQDLINRQIVEQSGGCENTPTQKHLLDLCREVAKHQKINLNDPFFEMGINSLDLIRLSQKAEIIFSGKITLADFFAYPSVVQLAAFLDGKNILEAYGIPLPEDFYRGRYNEKNYHYYQYTISDQLVMSLQKIALLHEVDLGDLILAAFFFSIKTIAGQAQISLLELAGDLSYLYLISPFDDCYQTFLDLAKVIHQQRLSDNNNGCYKFSEINGKISKKQVKRSLLLFYTNQDILESDVTDLFDIVVQLVGKQEKLKIVFDFNNLKLDGKPMLNLCNLFIGMVEAIPEKTSSLNTTIGA